MTGAAVVGGIVVVGAAVVGVLDVVSMAVVTEEVGTADALVEGAGIAMSAFGLELHPPATRQPTARTDNHDRSDTMHRRLRNRDVL